jgi:hypothetical protein
LCNQINLKLINTNGTLTEKIKADFDNQYFRGVGRGTVGQCEKNPVKK